MLALSPPGFPTFGWPLEDPIGNENIYFSREINTTAAITSVPGSTSFRYFFQSQPSEILQLDQSKSFTADYSTSNPYMAKKLNHNASERYRRKKMNSLYSSLRSLLPVADQMKKLSIPSTVSRVLKYIPELQQQVEWLVQRKEDLLSMISKQQHYHLFNHDEELKQSKSTKNSTSPVVSITQLSDTEVLIQISSTYNVHTIPLSEILHHLEDEGLVLINSSSFQSFGGRVFYNLHLQVDGTYTLECEALSEKFVSLYEKREGQLP